MKLGEEISGQARPGRRPRDGGADGRRGGPRPWR